MESLEKAKLALRKHLLENKEKVAADLNAMRSNSGGKDIFNYIDKMSNAFSLESLTYTSEVSYDYEFQSLDIYDLISPIVEPAYIPPPSEVCNKTKKDPEENQSLFFW